MRKTTEGKFLGKLVKSANLVVFQQKTKRGRQDKYGRHLPGAHSRVDLHIRLVVLIPVDDIGVDTQSPGDAFSRDAPFRATLAKLASTQVGRGG